MARDAVAEIKARIDLVEVISPYVALRRSGRSWKGLCPFHSEKTPSFHVDAERGFYRCYGCGAAGDAFSFLQQREGLSFVEAGELLARKAGVEWNRRGESGEARSQRQRLFDINALAVRFFRRQLEMAGYIQSYLKGRGISSDSIQRFQLGYAPPGHNALLQWLRREQVSMEDAEAANLLVRDDRGGYRDRFTDRLMFPVCDLQERVAGFGGRTMQQDGIPKYLNTRETPVFSKGSLLFGMHLARDAAREAGFMVAVEGYMDVIALHQAGMANCVAGMGTALTDTQVATLRRCLGETGELIVCYDSDSAGLAAALRGSAMFEAAGLEVRVAQLPPGQDPASMVEAGDASHLRERLNLADPLLDFRLKQVRGRFNLADPQQRLAFAREAARAVAASGSSVVRQEYGERISHILEGLAGEWYPGDPHAAARARQALMEEVWRLLAPSRKRGGADRQLHTPAAPPGSGAAVEKYVLRAALTEERWADLVAREADPSLFRSSALRDLASKLIPESTETTAAQRSQIIRGDPALAPLISSLLLDPSPLSDEGLRTCLESLRRNRLEERRSELRSLLESGAAALDGPEAREFRELCGRLSGGRYQAE